ncbi:hypothetical protein NOR51B_300 [Luminiphilus syltensis NOR5-1B]|uniref:PEP-CTERM sorting domain-containing protein n=1 Tax=Luminiphilus syltensis NOR5-1B TaxID=565045 RepID=B8KWE4_9GAMM|nr:hypothetical protein [Luminiphilus syltensis]EED34363.1 hypothetical protein NOR51B_300 [Luminiphilus syltensis NOR5-1B]
MIMKATLRAATAVIAALLLTSAVAAKPDKKSGPGEVLVGVNASEFDSTTAFDPPNGIYPVGGSGIPNGEFTVARRLGIEIGLRATERFEGPYPAYPNENGKVGIYQSVTGQSESATGTPGAIWNYEFHIDLRGARGVAKGTTLSDYNATIDSNFWEELSEASGIPLPFSLNVDTPVSNGNAVLFQGSQNALFGNPFFDVNEPDTYEMTLTLTPETFNGPPLSVSIEINVIDE